MLAFSSASTSYIVTAEADFPKIPSPFEFLTRTLKFMWYSTSLGVMKVTSVGWGVANSIDEMLEVTSVVPV